MTDTRESNSPIVVGEADEFSKEDEASLEPVPKRQRKSRNESEKRRREKLNVYISELANMVPLCSAAQRKLDKTTILRLTVNYIKVYNDLTMSVLGASRSGGQSVLLSSDELGELMDQILNGFLIVLTRTGKLVYVSDSVESLLGYNKEDVLGKSIYDILHPDDRQHVTKELTREDTILFCPTSVERAGLGALTAEQNSRIGKLPSRRAFEIRVKVSENDKEEEKKKEKEKLYEKLHCVGYMDNWTSQQIPSVTQGIIKGPQQLQLRQQTGVGTEDKSEYFVGVALVTRSNLMRPPSSETYNTAKEFLSKHTLDGKFLFVDTRSISITGYLPYEVLGSSIYKYVHHDDIKIVTNYHQTLMDYGECTSGYYRFLTKGEQWIWTQSRNYISYNHWNSKPELYVSTNQVISEEEGMKILDERDQQEKVLSLQIQQPLTAIDICSADAQEANTHTLAPWSSVDTCNAPVSRPDTARLLPVRSGSAAVSTTAGQLENASSSSVRTDSDGDVTMTEDIKEEQSKNLAVLSSKDLVSFIEAQRQLHEQLAKKHSILEESIAKQKEQLKIIQQHMFLNIQAQLTVDPKKNQEVIAREFEKTRILTEEHEKQEKRQQQLSTKLAEQKKKVNERYQTQLKQLLGNIPNLLEELSVPHPLQPWKSHSSSTEEKTVSKQKSATYTRTSNQLQDIMRTEDQLRSSQSPSVRQLLQQFPGTLEAGGQSHNSHVNNQTSREQGNNTFGNRELQQPMQSLLLQQLQNQPPSQPFPGSVQGQPQRTPTVNLWQQQINDWQLQKQQQQQMHGPSSEIHQVSTLDHPVSLPQNLVFSDRLLGSAAGISSLDLSGVSLQKQNAANHLQQHEQTPVLQNLQELLSSRENVVRLVSSLGARQDLSVALLNILQQVQSSASPNVSYQSQVSTTPSLSYSSVRTSQFQPSIGQGKVPLPVFQQQPQQQESCEQIRKHTAIYQGSLQQQYNPLLTEHQELLNMQQEQGKQLIVNQQRQENDAELEQGRADLHHSQKQHSQGEAYQPTALQSNTSVATQLLHVHDKTQGPHYNLVLEQSIKDEGFKYAPSGASGSTSTWDQSLNPLDMEIGEEDDQVLNLLLAEAALDPFFMDPIFWADDSNYVANLNPD